MYSHSVKINNIANITQPHTVCTCGAVFGGLCYGPTSTVAFGIGTTGTEGVALGICGAGNGTCKGSAINCTTGGETASILGGADVGDGVAVSGSATAAAVAAASTAAIVATNFFIFFS